MFRKNSLFSISAAIGSMLGMLMTFSATGAEQALTVKPELHIKSAEQSAMFKYTMMLGVARAGKRVVAVGDQGVITLSDDDGKTVRQAQSVPVQSTLTGVWFVDDKTGWAVGHWGVILKTSDGGVTWSLQRSDINIDQPLFSVYFKNGNEGWAVGLWSLMLHTTDGGASWEKVTLPAAPGTKKVDRNFYSIFANAAGDVFITCEQGQVLRSAGGDNNWASIDTGYKGSLWSGIALSDGTLVIGGLRGSIYRSTDNGDTWNKVEVDSAASITGFVIRGDNMLVAFGLDGVILESRDNALTFTKKQRADRASITTGIQSGENGTILFGKAGQLTQQDN